MIIQSNVVELNKLRNGMSMSMQHAPVITHLNGLFNYLTVEDWQAIFDRGDFVSYEDGQTILMEGIENGSLFYIDEGEVRVVRTEDNRQVELARLGAGGLFGEISIVDDAPLNATLVALGIVDVIRIEREELERAFELDCGLGMRFYRSLAETLARRLRKSIRLMRTAP